MSTPASGSAAARLLRACPARRFARPRAHGRCPSALPRSLRWPWRPRRDGVRCVQTELIEHGILAREIVRGSPGVPHVCVPCSHLQRAPPAAAHQQRKPRQRLPPGRTQVPVARNGAGSRHRLTRVAASPAPEIHSTPVEPRAIRGPDPFGHTRSIAVTGCAHGARCFGCGQYGPGRPAMRRMAPSDHEQIRALGQSFRGYDRLD
jgi:hypothetical protein